MDNNLENYEDIIHEKLQSIRYKFNHLIHHINDNLPENTKELYNLQLDILNLELDNINLKLDNYINDTGYFYPKQKYAEIESNYLILLQKKLKNTYLDEQKKKKHTIMSSMLPMLLHFMMLNDKDSIYNSNAFNKKQTPDENFLSSLIPENKKDTDNIEN